MAVAYAIYDIRGMYVGNDRHVYTLYCTAY
jgi:hypothetical protein